MIDAAPTILALMAAGVAGLIAEVGARAAFRRGGDYVWRPGERMVMHLDPKVLPELPAVAHFNVNGDGERGAEPPPSSQRVWRMVMVGGSLVECYYLDQRLSWPEIVADDLRGEREFLRAVGRDDVHVGNLGKSGVDSAGVNLILDRVLPRYRHLDCIIFCLGVGDVMNWLADGAPARPQKAADLAASVFAVRSDQRFTWAPRGTALAELLRVSLTSRVPRVRERAGKKLGEVREMRRKAKDVLTTVPDASEMLTSFETNLSAALLKAKRKARHVLVLRQAWLDKDQLTPDEEKLLWHAAKGRPYLQPVDTFFSHRVFNDLMRSIDDKVVRVCADTGTAALDLKALLPNATESYYDHLHFTTAGAERAGHAVAGFVKAVVAHNSAAPVRAE